MTANQIALDAQYLVKTQPIARRGWPTSTDMIIARFDRTELDGQFDKDEQNLRRSRTGEVNGAMMMCQVATLGSDTLMIFWDLETGHQRRILVDGDRLFMDVDGRAVRIGTNNKYFAPCQAILKARAN